MSAPAGVRPAVTTQPDVGNGLSIQAVSKLLDVPAPTIRSWERRYGIPTTTRSNGGHRRFLPDELAMLRRMRDEVARGHRAAEAAAIVKEQSRERSPYQGLIDEFLEAAYRLEPRGIDALLEQARDRIGLDHTICAVLLPAMRQIGLWWESGRCDVAHEHLATEASRAWLNRLLYLGPTPWRGQNIILACGPRDVHTLGLEALGVMLSRRGYGCRVLGARTPGRSLMSAVQATDASAVVLVSHMSVGRRSAVEALQGLRSTNAHLFFAGNAFLTPQARQGVPGTFLGENLVAAVDIVDVALTPDGGTGAVPTLGTGRSVG